MTLSNEINNLPAAVGEGSAGHLGNHRVIHEALKVHDADIQAAMTSADTASTTVRDVEARVSSVEAVAGLSPESPVDGQTANLILQDETLTRAAASTVVRSVVYDVSPTGTLEGDKVAVIAAAQEAKDEGRTEVYMAPGHYRLDGVNVDDIYDRYLVGDGVTFTPASHVYPFRIGEMAARSVEAPMEGGRGAIAFEVDDADPSHWQSLFPLTKELGVPFGLSWITGRAGTEWVKEAARHGWELMSHLTYDTDATAVSSAELETIAEESVDALEWATGTRAGHGIVYPRHVRSMETDRILSKYFARGRAGSYRNARPMDAPNPWGYQAFDFDGHLGGGMSDEMKDILNSVAASNSKMVFFTHWRASGAENLSIGFREMVNYARNLGIAIKLPKQLMTRPQIVPDPYFERDVWTKTTSGGEYDTTVKYHGTKSVKADSTGNVGMQSSSVFVGSRPGFFTVARVGVRVKTEGAAASSYTQGILFKMQTYTRDEHGHRSSSPVVTMPPLVPGPAIPAQDWTRYRKTLFINPNVDLILPRWHAQNIREGELWLDESQIDIVDYVPEMEVEATTNRQNATANNTTDVWNHDLRDLSYRVEPIDVFTGEISVDIGINTVNVKSTESLDNNKRVRIIFTPPRNHLSREWSTEGA